MTSRSFSGCSCCQELASGADGCDAEVRIGVSEAHLIEALPNKLVSLWHFGFEIRLFHRLVRSHS